MDSPNYIQTPFVRPSPHPLDASAQALALSPSAGPPPPVPRAWRSADPSHSNSSSSTDSSSSTNSSTASPAEWSWSQNSTSSSSSAASSCYSPSSLSQAGDGEDGVDGKAAAAAAATDEPLLYRNSLQPATSASAAARRSFASRTARDFQARHPTAHAFVLSFARTPRRTVQTTGSVMYANLDGWDLAAEDPDKEEPTIFGSVGWSAGPGEDTERFDVYLCQSGRFSLGEVANDENVWGFASPQWEKVGPYVFFEHM